MDDCVAEGAKAKVAALKDGDVLLLENLRFNPGEKKGDPEFEKQLAKLADVYVSDAFGTAHREDFAVIVFVLRLTASLESEVLFLGVARFRMRGHYCSNRHIPMPGYFRLKFIRAWAIDIAAAYA